MPAPLLAVRWGTLTLAAGFQGSVFGASVVILLTCPYRWLVMVALGVLVLTVLTLAITTSILTTKESKDDADEAQHQQLVCELQEEKAALEVKIEILERDERLRSSIHWTAIDNIHDEIDDLQRDVASLNEEIHGRKGFHISWRPK